MTPVPGVLSVKPLGHEDLDRLADEFFARVTEETLGLSVDDLHEPAAIDDYHRVGSRFEEIAELLFFVLATRDVSVGFKDGDGLAGGVGAQGPAARHDDFGAFARVMNDFAFPRAPRANLRLDLGKSDRELLLKKLARDLTARFGCVPSVEMFRSAVPIDDLVFHISYEDRIVSEVEQLCLLAVAGFAGAEIELDVAALVHFLIEGGVGFDPIAQIRKVDRLWSDANKQNCGGNGGGGGDRLDDSGEPVVAVPEIPDFHQMRRATGNDEKAEQSEHPTEGDISALAYEPKKNDGNREVRERDQRIGYHVQIDQPRVPEVAHAVRHEALGAEKLAQDFHAFPFSPTGTPDESESESADVVRPRRAERTSASADKG